MRDYVHNASRNNQRETLSLGDECGSIVSNGMDASETCHGRSNSSNNTANDNDITTTTTTNNNNNNNNNYKSVTSLNYDVTYPADAILLRSQTSGLTAEHDACASHDGHDVTMMSSDVVVSIQDGGGWTTVPTFGYVPLVIFGTVNFALSFGMPTSLSAFFLDWQASFQVSRASAATIHATCLGILNTGAVIPGFLMNRFGARPTLLAGSCMATLGLILSPFATSITHLVFSVGVLGGMGFCMMNLPIIPSVTLPFTSYRSLIISCLSLGSSISNAGLTYLYRYMANQLSWRGAFFLLGGIALNSCVTGLVVTSFIRQRVTRAVSKEGEQLLSTEEDILERDEDAPEECDSGITLASDTNRAGERTSDGQEEVTMPYDENSFSEYDDGYSDEKPPVEKEGRINSKLQNSKLLFLLDPLYVLVVVNTAICIPSVGSLIYLLMDFAVNRGFTGESTGVLFLFIAFIFSAVGKILSGVLNVIPKVKSVFIMMGFGLVGAVCLVVLTYMDGFYQLALVLALLGLCFGGLAGIYPKCVLDMSSVNAESFPLALGIANTMEGLFDSSGPILMGYLVDIYGSYNLPLLLFSGSCSLASLSLFVVYWLTAVRQNK